MECPRPNLNQVSFHNYSECRESRLQGVQSSERRGQEKPWVCPLALSSCHSDAPKTTEFQLEVKSTEGKFAGKKTMLRFCRPKQCHLHHHKTLPFPPASSYNTLLEINLLSTQHLGELNAGQPWELSLYLHPQALLELNLLSVQHLDRLDVGELWELPLQVLAPLRLDSTLVRLLPDLENPVHDLHALHYLRERGEPHPVQIGVVAEVDERLRRARVLPRRGEADHAASLPRRGEADHAADVGFEDRIVYQALVNPLLGDGGLGVDAVLGHEPVDDAEEPDPLVKVGGHHLLEARRALRSPLRVEFQHEAAPLAILAVQIRQVEAIFDHGGLDLAQRSGRQKGKQA